MDIPELETKRKSSLKPQTGYICRTQQESSILLDTNTIKSEKINTWSIFINQNVFNDKTTS